MATKFSDYYCNTILKYSNSEIWDYMYKYGNFYWGSYHRSMLSSNYACNVLCYNPYFQFNGTSSMIKYNQKIRVSSSTPTIIPLHNNEIALLLQTITLCSYFTY